MKLMLDMIEKIYWGHEISNERQLIVTRITAEKSIPSGGVWNHLKWNKYNN